MRLPVDSQKAASSGRQSAMSAPLPPGTTYLPPIQQIMSQIEAQVAEMNALAQDTGRKVHAIVEMAANAVDLSAQQVTAARAEALAARQDAAARRDATPDLTPQRHRGALAPVAPWADGFHPRGIRV